MSKCLWLRKNIWDDSGWEDLPSILRDWGKNWQDLTRGSSKSNGKIALRRKEKVGVEWGISE